MTIEIQEASKKLSSKSFISIFMAPLFIYAFSSIILNLETFKPIIGPLSIAVTYDAIITAPLIYLLLIWNKPINKTTVIPVIFVSILFASYIIPNENQDHLEIIKTWAIPVIETFAISVITIKAVKITKSYKQQKLENPDVFSVIKTVIHDFAPGLLASYVSMELGSFYYFLIPWKRKKNHLDTFSSTSSGIIPVLSVLLFMILLETILLHILLMNWNTMIAWGLTALSIYSMVQLIAILKSIIFRPIEIKDNKLYLRYGILRESVIDLENICKIETTSISENSFSLSPFRAFEEANIKLHLKENGLLFNVFGKPVEYKSICFFVNNKERLIHKIKP